jgi:hypothetical protein
MEIVMPRRTRPVSVDERNMHVASAAQRVQAWWWTAGAEDKTELRHRWPELAAAIDALDETLQMPVIGRGAWATEP